jgi:hypothetical protein
MHLTFLITEKNFQRFKVIFKNLIVNYEKYEKVSSLSNYRLLYADVLGL